LSRTRVFASYVGAFRLVGYRFTLAQPTVWSHAGNAFFVNGEGVDLTDVLFVGQLGPITQPFALPTVTLVSGVPGAVTLTRGRVAHYRASPTSRAGGALFTYGSASFGLDRTLSFSQVSFTDVNLGVRAARPGMPFDMTGPIFDGPGFAGFPGRWWVDSLPFFTQGNTCSPGPRDSSTSGEVCAAPGYFSMFGVRVSTALGPNDVVAAELVREISGSPAVAARVGQSVNGRSEALPVPLNETVRLRFPAYATTPRLVRLITFGLPGERAVLRIPYPATTTFIVELRNEQNLHFTGYQPITMMAVTSLAALTSDPGGTKFFFDGAFLYISLRADWPNLGPYFRHELIITANHPTLP